MGRLSQGMVTGGIIAAVAGLVMRRNGRRQNMTNRMMNSMISLMGNLGMFRLFSKTKMFRNMVKMR